MMEEALSLPQKYLKVVSELAASGAVGAALLLGVAPPAAADQEPATRQPTSAPGERVSERLAAIRDAVSAVSGAPAEAADQLRLAWGNWRNGGWGGGGWGRPWGNFGFGLPWNNWNNWRNGWNNWRNWWRNF
jgi:rSAM-associated Gly-rich repeat protein